MADQLRKRGPRTQATGRRVLSQYPVVAHAVGPLDGNAPGRVGSRSQDVRSPSIEADGRTASESEGIDQLEASSSQAKSPVMRVSLVIVVLAFTHAASAASAALACSSDSHWLIDTTLSSSNITP